VLVVLLCLTIVQFVLPIAWAISFNAPDVIAWLMNIILDPIQFILLLIHRDLKDLSLVFDSLVDLKNE